MPHSVVPENCSVQTDEYETGKTFSLEQQVLGECGGTRPKYLQLSCGFLRLINCQVSLCPSAVRQRAGGFHTGTEISRTYFSLFFRQWDQGKSQGLHINGGVRSRNRLLKAKGTVGHGAQQLPHGDSGDGHQQWPPRTETHRQACGKTIRCPSLPPNHNLISPTGKLSTNVAKIPGGVLRVGGTGGQLRQHPSFLLRSIHTLSCAKQKQKTETFRKHPLGDVLSIICAG